METSAWAFEHDYEFRYPIAFSERILVGSWSVMFNLP
jgi:hypothetical protein